MYAIDLENVDRYFCSFIVLIVGVEAIEAAAGSLDVRSVINRISFHDQNSDPASRITPYLV